MIYIYIILVRYNIGNIMMVTYTGNTGKVSIGNRGQVHMVSYHVHNYNTGKASSGGKVGNYHCWAR